MARYCFLGASITEGVGDATRTGWVGNLSQLQAPDVIVYNLGIRGDTIFDVRNRGLAECRNRMSEEEPTKVVVGCPLNDLAHLNDGSDRRSNVEILSCYNELLDELSELGPTFVVGPPPVLPQKMPFRSATSALTWDYRNEEIQQFDQSLRKVMEQNSTPYASVFTELLNINDYMEGLEITDGLHPDTAGHVAMARSISDNPAWKKFVEI